MRSRDRKKILKEYPFCVYCGGYNQAETIDHMPPIGMFVKRARQPGLFMPSCSQCNQNSSPLDDLAALFVALRIAPSEAEKQHFIVRRQSYWVQ